MEDLPETLSMKPCPCKDYKDDVSRLCSSWIVEGIGIDGRMSQAMAARVVAAWNALEGWPTEALEAGAVQELRDAAGEVVIAETMALALRDAGRFVTPPYAAHARLETALVRDMEGEANAP